jgi:predicted ATPase
MRRYILTGAPGAGKTVLLRRLEVAGYAVVEEAATDINALSIGRRIAHPYLEPTFIDDILALQLSRQARADAWRDEVVVFDRSPVCTLVLAEFLDREVPPALDAEIERIRRGGAYEPRVLFVEMSDRIVNTDVRRITYEDARRFEAVHEDVYRRLGFELVHVPMGDVEARFEIARRVMSGAA